MLLFRLSQAELLKTHIYKFKMVQKPAEFGFTLILADDAKLLY